MFTMKKNDPIHFYFDTSVINSFSRSRETMILSSLLNVDFKIYFSSINLIEGLLISEVVLRDRYLAFIRSNSNNFRPLAFPFDVLRKTLNLFRKNISKGSFAISRKQEDLWRALNYPERINEKFLNEVRRIKDHEENWFVESHINARENFQEIISKADRPISSSGRFIKLFCEKDQFINDILSSFSLPQEELDYLGNNGHHIINELEHWTFFWSGFLNSVFDRACKKRDYGRKNTFGGLDWQQIVYLPFVNVFVTSDKNQYKLFRRISKLGKIPRSVIRIDEFKRKYLKNI